MITLTITILNCMILGVIVVEGRIISKRLEITRDNIQRIKENTVDLNVRTIQLQDTVEGFGYKDTEIEKLISKTNCLDDNIREQFEKVNKNIGKAKMEILFTPRPIKIIEEEEK